MTQGSGQTRVPYDAHLCAQNPALWEAGFNFAATWVPIASRLDPGRVEKIHRAVRDSDGGLDWRALGLPHEAWQEGFVLGVYGLVVLREAAA